MIHRASLLSLLLAAAAGAAEVDASRVAGMTGPDAGSWREYVERSARLAAADQDALRGEVTAAGLTEAIKPPTGGDFRPPDGDDQDWFGGAAARELADTVISFQAPSGGWSKHLGYGKGPRRPGMQWTSQSDPGRPPHYLATFDNGATVREIEFLAAVWDASRRDDCRAAAVRGLEFILNAQFPNGGWPQVYPLEGGYHDNVTFNDNAMTNVMRLVQRVVDGDPRFAFVADDQRRRLAAALDRGLDWVVASQVTVDGRATVWCAQHDPITREPTAARAFEPASLSGVESAQVLKFLMGLRQPSPKVVSCIEQGLAWLEAAEVKGITKTRRDGRTLYVVDASSSEGYWARFYDLTTGRPMFPGKDGVVYATFEAMAASNENIGYDYYSTQPGSVVRNGQKKWRKRLAELREAAP